MKSLNKKFFAVAFAFSLAIGLSSCENVITEDYPSDGVAVSMGGEDTDRPILIGLVIDSEEEPIYPSELILYDDLTSSVVDTAHADASGKFRFDPLDSGYYYIDVLVSNVSVVTSSVIEVQDSTYVIIQK
ncbi:MAG: hypothetical protein EP346_07375 [Bacteroidetes bacterium]|nr:MAG: hypothetical protein EP346_07375 [Bacteroidota bacterium]